MSVIVKRANVKMVGHNSTEKNSDLRNRILNFVSDELRLAKEKLRLDASLSHEYGVDGDDAVEFLQLYSETFDVDLSGFEIEKYFYHEGSMSLVAFLFEWLSGKKKAKKKFLTIKDLIDGAYKGRLN